MIGMRLGEISKLRWHQLDFDAGTISIGLTQKRSASASRVKTNAGKRTIAMPDKLCPIFADHAAFIAKKLGPTEQDWYVFPLCNRRRPVDPCVRSPTSSPPGQLCGLLPGYSAGFTICTTRPIQT